MIREARERLGLSQEFMARLLGCSYASISRWEHGQGTPGRLHRTLFEALHEIATTKPDAGEQLQRAVTKRGAAYGIYALLKMKYGGKG